MQNIRGSAVFLGNGGWVCIVTPSQSHSLCVFVCVLVCVCVLKCVFVSLALCHWVTVRVTLGVCMLHSLGVCVCVYGKCVVYVCVYVGVCVCVSA